ncbi:MAG: hypothetical protein ACO1O6_13785 [Bacteroidota bacterium]
MKLRINFVLKNNIKGEIPIIAIINFGYKEYDVIKKVYIYKPLRYYTGIKVVQGDWDEKEKLPLSNAKRANVIQLQKTIEDVFNYLSLKEEVSNENLKMELDLKFKNKDESKVIKRVRIVDFIEQDVLKSDRIKPATKKAYNGLKNKLEDFEKKIKKHLYSNDINEELYKQFLNDMKLRLNRINSVWGVNKVFKAVLHEISRKHKIKVFSPGSELASNDKIQAVSEDKLYLDFEQIQKILEHEPRNESLRNTKLILLTLLFTGCRHSDVHKIKPEFVYDKNGVKFHYARYFSEKTDTEIIIPILKPLMDEILKNGGNVAYEISQQKFNAYVKDLAKDCKLEDEVTFSFTDSTGKKQLESKPLYQFVSSHTGRRSFVTNLINYVPITILTKITGHQLTEKSVIFGYNKISLLDNAAMFVKELKRLYDDNRDHFKFELV